MEKKQESNINSTNDIAENTEAENQNELKSDSQIMEEEEKVNSLIPRGRLEALGGAKKQKQKTLMSLEGPNRLGYI